MNKYLTKLADKLPGVVKQRVRNQIEKYVRGDLKDATKNEGKRKQKNNMLTGRANMHRQLSKQTGGDERLSQTLRGSAVRDRLLRRLLTNAKPK